MFKFTNIKSTSLIITAIFLTVFALIFKEVTEPDLAEEENGSNHQRSSSAQVKMQSAEERAANRSRVRSRRDRSPDRKVEMVISSIHHLNERQLEESQAAILKMSVQDIDKLLAHQAFQDLTFRDPYQNKLFGTCFTRLAMLDPEHAITYRKRLSPTGNFHSLSRIFEQWIKDDEGRAREVALQMKSDAYLRDETMFIPEVMISQYDEEREDN